MPQKKDEAFLRILSDYENLANMVLKQLDEVKKMISEMNQLRDAALLLDLKSREEKINKLEVRLSENVINSIALYQPVASEIRKLISCYRIVISMERMGDLAMTVAKLHAGIEHQEVYISLSGFITKMLDLSVDMARRSMLSFLNEDMELALWTIKTETVVDEFNHRMLNKVAERAETVSEDKNLLLSFIKIKEMVSSIERIADHAANIAEASYYSHEGKDIRHKRK
jgi:phosphate transport system protein